MSGTLTTMKPVTTTTAKGSAVGAAEGVVHLLDWTYTDRLLSAPNVVVLRAIGVCGKDLGGKPVEREGAEPTCQACIDERDYRAAMAAGFEHRVRAVRRPLGRSLIAMRYGAQVDCYTCPAETHNERKLWYSNRPGQMRKAEEIARQHFLDKYRETLATVLSAVRLADLRAQGRAKRHGFFDRHMIAQCAAVLDKRGEKWAAVILGRDISRRSVGVPNRPWLHYGEAYTLVAADVEEDKPRFDQIIRAAGCDQ